MRARLQPSIRSWAEFQEVHRVVGLRKAARESSWVLDPEAVDLGARRLAPGDDTATITARQLRELIEQLIAIGQWQPGKPDVLSSRTPDTTHLA